MEIESFVFSLIGALLAAGGFLYNHYKDSRALSDRISTLEGVQTGDAETKERVKELEKNVSNLTQRQVANETKMELFWGALQGKVIDMLKHPTEQNLDDLMDKLDVKTITLKEMEELKALLKCKAEKPARTEKQKNESFLAAFLLARVDGLLYDARTSFLK